jgi:hypothetical protein
MPAECSMVFPDGEFLKLETLEAGAVWFVKEHTDEVTKVIAIHCDYQDSGVAVHELEEYEVDFEEMREAGEVPDDLLSEDNQVGYVFANTFYKKPANIPQSCGRLLIAHTLPARSLN